MGRPPTKTIDLGDVRPLYDTDTHNKLIPSAELISLATSTYLGVIHLVIHTQHTPDSRFKPGGVILDTGSWRNAQQR
eukprot:scaffold329473_cov52-Tisochrysis_lutea.AAC.1